MSKSIKRATAVTFAALLVATGLSACSSDKGDDDASAPTTVAEEAADGDAEDAEEGGDDEAGFDEYPIGDEQFVGPLAVSGVYFQPVPMEPEMGVPFAEASMHLEADIVAVPDNDLGYGAGDFVPGLKVEYKIFDGDKEVQSGTFMPMVASDGPHYGLNLPALEAGLYKVQFIIHSPEAEGWMLHTDPVTGVKGRYWTEPLIAEFDNWQWDPETAPW